jgi:LemA protein
MDTQNNMPETMAQTMNTMTQGIKGLKGGLLLGIVAVIIIIWGIGVRNSIVTKGLAVDKSFAMIDTDLQRRFDLVPNLVNAVKGLTAQEQKVFGDIANARSHYAGAQTTNDKVAAGKEFESALSRLLVITENYPQLRSSEAFQSLMAQLEGTENRIAIARKDYNDAVTVYNTTIIRFPSNIIAMIFNYDAKKLFEATEQTRTNPTVDFTK